MPLKKSELYSSLWSSCDKLRGGMDSSQYKDYVLVLLFMKYVSDKCAGRKNALIDVPKGAGFADMVALKGDNEIGDKVNKIIGRLTEANDLRGGAVAAYLFATASDTLEHPPASVPVRGGRTWVPRRVGRGDDT